MERLTAKRVNGIKRGYWSSAKKEELVQALGKYEDTGYSPEEILRVSKSTVTRFDLFKGMGSDMAAQMILDLAKRFDNRETLRDYISEVVSEEELRRIDAAAKKYGDQPLSFSLKMSNPTPIELYKATRDTFQVGGEMKRLTADEILRNMSTKQLVTELTKRVGVVAEYIEPHTEKTFTESGSMILLKVTD